MAMTARRIAKKPEVQACINCVHYRQYFQIEQVKGESCKVLKPVGTGWCQHFGKQRGALRQPCPDYTAQTDRDAV